MREIFKYGMFFCFVLIVSCKPEADGPIFDIKDQTDCVIDENDHIYISTHDSLYRFSQGAWEHLHFVSEGAIIYGLAIADNSDLWMASSEGLLNYSHDTIYVSAEDSLSSTDIKQLAIDDAGNFYVATSKDVSVFYQGRWYRTEGMDEIFRNEKVTDIAVASNNYVYVTTLGGGVGRFYVDVDGISGATNFDTDWSRLQSNNVRTVFVDDTVQWYGSEGGVAVHYSKNTKWDWEVFDVEDGLVSDTITSIVKDGEGAMWFASARGVSRYDGEEWVNFRAGDSELVNDTVSFLAVDEDGNCWLTYPSGIMKYTGSGFVNYEKD